MSLKKYVSFSLIFLFTLILVTGCADKKELSSDEFESIMIKEEFSVIDNTDNYKELSKVKKVLVATDIDSSFKIEYYVFNDVKNAEELFDKKENKFKNTSSLKKTQYQTYGLGNYSYYSLTTDDYYKVVSRIGKTVVVTDSNVEHKEKLKKVFKKIGY